MDSRKQILQIMTNLLITFLSAILIGCTDGNGASQRITGKDAHDSIMLADGYEMLPIFKTKTGHITVTIKVNGKPCVFLVDTGGGGTLLDISKKVKIPARTSSNKRLRRRHRLCQSFNQDIC